MIYAVLREGGLSARSQPVASVVTILMIIGMVLAVMLTTGRTVGAEQKILGSIDSAGTRSITIRAEQGSGVVSGVMERIDCIEGIEWAGAFSAAADATNSALPDGARVPVRHAYGKQLDRLGILPDAVAPGSAAWASPVALEQFGLPDIAGSVTVTSGATYGVAGELVTPDFLSGFEPVVLVPQPASTGNEAVAVIVVIAEDPRLVAPVGDAVVSVLGADDPGKVTVQTSEALAQLRSLIQGQFGGFSRGLVLVLLTLTGALIAILLYGLVMMRRKDFGRRRALGATQGTIVALLLTQTAILAGIGIGIGVSTAFLILIATGDPPPGVAFVAALAVLSFVTALTAALIPALIASRREPIRELRVP